MATPQVCLLLYLFAINILAWVMFGVDKYKARHDLSRISEGTLWLFAFLGGAVGAWMGMRTFRHKTRHFQFVAGIPMIVILNGAVFALFFHLFR